MTPATAAAVSAVLALARNLQRKHHINKGLNLFQQQPEVDCSASWVTRMRTHGDCVVNIMARPTVLALVSGSDGDSIW